jgi:hypothetical protein
MFINSREMQLPVAVTPRRDPIRELVLFRSDDGGRTYTQVAAAGPDEKHFRVRVPRDGVYWFVLQVQTNGGTVVPENVASATPNLKVCVDTTPPVGELKAAALPGGRVCAGWSVRDENLDEASVGLEYRAAGSGAWQPLTIRPAADGAHVWEPAGRGPVEVRLRAKDLAGNATEVIAKAEPADEK